VKLLVADDHTLFRDGLVNLLEAAGFAAISQVGHGAAAVTEALALRPDVVLVDMDMADMSGLEVLRRIRAQWPEAQVVLLTDAEDDAELLEVIDAGARGYLSKSLNAEEFIRMLHGLGRGEAALTRHTTGRLLNALSHANRRTSHDLTEREVELLRLIVEGCSNRHIAQALQVSENTVKYHIKNILQKLAVHNRTEAATHALRVGLVRSTTHVAPN
jgi:DNA-binding NarL/FixJ family response regulator